VGISKKNDPNIVTTDFASTIQEFKKPLIDSSITQTPTKVSVQKTGSNKKIQESHQRQSFSYWDTLKSEFLLTDPYAAIESEIFIGSLDENNSRAGPGKLLLPNGDFFIGNFEINEFDSGTYYYRGGDRYTGSFIENLFDDDNGLMIFSSKQPYGLEKYKGRFSGGQKIGNGCLHFKNGNTIEGHYGRSGIFEGVTAFYYFMDADDPREKYFGNFGNDGQFVNQGKISFKNGDVYDGEFGAQNEISGVGSYKWKNSNLGHTQFNGTWASQGFVNGRLVFNNGNWYNGQFDGENLFHGYGEFYDRNLEQSKPCVSITYKGHWRHGVKNGKGKVLEVVDSIKGEIVRELDGDWVSGKFITQNSKIYANDEKPKCYSSKYSASLRAESKNGNNSVMTIQSGDKIPITCSQPQLHAQTEAKKAKSLNRTQGSKVPLVNIAQAEDGVVFNLERKDTKDLKRKSDKSTENRVLVKNAERSNAVLCWVAKKADGGQKEKSNGKDYFKGYLGKKGFEETGGLDDNTFLKKLKQDNVVNKPDLGDQTQNPPLTDWKTFEQVIVREASIEDSEFKILQENLKFLKLKEKLSGIAKASNRLVDSARRSQEKRQSESDRKAELLAKAELVRKTEESKVREAEEELIRKNAEERAGMLQRMKEMTEKLRNDKTVKQCQEQA
jgi:hypothetical protein